jgi:hypothetical protein
MKALYLPFSLTVAVALLALAACSSSPPGDDDDSSTPTQDAGTIVDEAEPNDEMGDWQDLGTLGEGRWLVRGVATTGGHDVDNNPSGDLDVFLFELESATTVNFEMNWPNRANDFDAILYDNASGSAQLGFNSPDEISADMATLERPEVLSLDLSAGVGYALMIALYDGVPASEWEMSIEVEP